MVRILVSDDDQSIRETLSGYLRRKNYEVQQVENGKEALEKLNEFRPHIIISDIRMPEMDGMELLENIKEIDPEINVILMTAFDDMQTTVSAIRKGAFDYLEKPIDLAKLDATIEKALTNKELSQNLASIKDHNSTKFDLKNVLIGKTAMMKDIYKKIGMVADNRITVLLQGESGTGKELVARAIHSSGITRNAPFVAVNCTALSETLLESELFGHVKGAFTGAIKDKKGKFELAGEGTIFLDEISEISPSIQIKLLRVLQEKEFENVGGEKSIPLRARIICATNRNLKKEVEDGNFREDLFYRLSVVSIKIPALRDRSEDIPLLIRYFLKKINLELGKKVNKISDKLQESLKNHYWRGNVRELENALTQAVVLSQGDVLEENSFELVDDIKLNERIESDFLHLSLADVEKNHIKRMLVGLKWNKPEVAKRLGISLPTLYSKIESYKIVNE